MNPDTISPSLVRGYVNRIQRTKPAPAVPRTGRDRAPLSPGQHRLWLLDKIRPGSTEYLVPLVLRLRGPLDTESLRGALDGLVSRHAVLRSRYLESGGEPYQIVDPPARLTLDVREVGERELRARTIVAADEPRADEALAGLIAEVGERPFDLASEWPLRAALFRLAPREHVLLLVAHHIAVDGTSMDVLLDELAEGYRGGTPAAPALQYLDYADWQRSFLAGPSAGRQLAFWKEELAGLAPLEMPTDHPRPPDWDPRGDVVRFELPADAVGAALQEGARRSATPFMTLLAAFWAVLGRYTGGTDIAVGTPAGGRSRVEFERLVGFFVNTLVLRGDLTGDPSYGELIDQASRVVTDAHDHQDLPFERIVEELRPERDLSVNPLFQALFTYGDAAPEARRAGSLSVTEEVAGWAPARVDLALDLTRHADGSLSGALIYPTALFTRPTMERLAGHLLAFLRRAGRGASTPVSRIGLTSAAERRQVLTGWNATAVDRPPHCLPDRFAALAAARPDAVALQYGEAGMTYAELDQAANRLAHLLAARGAGPETRVAVCLDRSLDLVITLLATVKTGAAYVPIDPGYPLERIAYLVGDCAPHVVVTSGAHAHLLPQDAVVLDGADLTGYPATAPEVPRDPDSAAYVIYTSGSTGRPKGVLVSHRAIANRLDWMQDAYGLTGDDAVLQKTPFGFDVSVWEFFWPLAQGARLVLAEPGGHRDAGYLRDLITRAGITVCHFVPSMLRSFLDVPGVGACTSLREVICSGEALPRDLADRFHELLGARLHNLYGPTEAAVDVSAWQCVPGWRDARVPIGAPIDNISLYVLDEAMEPVPVGVPGELHIGGVGVARGYLGRPGLTAERFVPDPFARGRLYKTGDVARWRPDGTLDYLGRRDHQVKIRGHRIELGEVEAALLDHPGVRSAAVVVDDAGDPRLVAYVVGAAQGRELRTWLGERLPAYLVPALFVAMDELPVSAHGKLDRSALPSPRAQESEQEFVEPRDAAERLVAQAWAVALGLPAVGAHGNFFELGGDSIRALRAVGRLREAGWDVGVQDLFRHQTPAALAPVLRADRAPAGTGPLPPFAHVDAADLALLPSHLADAYPLTQVQAGMLFELGADEELNPYHNVTAYLVRDEGPFSLSALRAAAQLLVTRHDVLRTAFDLSRYSVPLQLVREHAELEITLEDLTGLPEPEQREAGEAALLRERQRPFDLARAPLWRLYVQRLTERRWRLGWVECHPILDGWSHNSLLSELLEAYRTIRDGHPVPEQGTPAVRFADHVALERAALDSDEQRDFWAGRVLGHERIRLPEVWADPGAADPFPYDLRVPVAELLPGLRALAKAAGTPLKSVLLAAHLKVMSMVTPQRRFRVGLGTNGRPEVEGGDQVRGMFLNIVPFSVDTEVATWRDLVRAVFEEETTLWPYRRYPAPEMRRRWSQDGPLIDVLFNYLDFHVLDRNSVDLAETEDRSPTDFTLVVSTEPGALVLSASPRAIAPAWGERLARLYGAVLTAMAADPAASAHGDCLPAEERPVSDGPARLPAASVHQLFARQAARTPRAVAVEFGTEFGTERLTYAELDARANRLAHLLRERGVGPDTPVGICMPRSADLIVAILGVLKADGVYLALDLADPPARLAELLADADARLVLTSAELAGSIDHPDVITLPAGTGPDTPPEPRATQENLAYLIYTSGSTGRPKAVAIPHRAVVRLVSDQEYAGFGPGQVQLLHSPITFDAATYEIWGALLRGGKLVVAPPRLLDARELREVIVRHGVTATFITHGLFKLMVDEEVDRLAGLRTLITGGEAVSAGHLEVARTALPGTRLVNGYGPTEVTTFATYHVIDPGEPVSGAVPIGLPIAHTQAYVLDSHGRITPTGVPGELHLGGPGVARGYLGRPSLTADRFVPDPFCAEPGTRMYRTGDLARRRPDGGLDFLGRVDDQVKIRGHRIEPGEVEAALHQHPLVRMAAVVAREITPGDRRLVGYVLPAGLDTAELRGHLIGLLPDYLVPDLLVSLEAFPMTASGKIDRAALPTPGGFRQDLEIPFAPPIGELEIAVAGVWSTVLGVDSVGRDDDFIEIGGHSLAAMRVAARLEDATGLRVSARDILVHRTVAALAGGITGSGRAATAPAITVRFRSSGGRAPLFCVHPGGGSVHWYRQLAASLPGDRPFLALQHPALVDEGAAGLPVESLAELYLAEIRAEQAAGPYQIFGWCGGAPVTWEIGARLRAAGEDVTVLLLDPCLPAAQTPLHLRLLRRGEELLDALAGTGGDAALRDELIEVLRTVVDDNDGRPVTAEELDQDWRPRLSLWRGMAEATQAYRLDPADVPVQILLTDDLMGDGHDAKGGLTHRDYLREWRRLRGGQVPVGRLRNGHLEVMDAPHVHELAARVASWLDGTGRAR